MSAVIRKDHRTADTRLDDRWVRSGAALVLVADALWLSSLAFPWVSGCVPGASASDLCGSSSTVDVLGMMAVIPLALTAVTAALALTTPLRGHLTGTMIAALAALAVPALCLSVLFYAVHPWSPFAEATSEMPWQSGAGMRLFTAGGLLSWVGVGVWAFTPTRGERTQDASCSSSVRARPDS